MSVSTKNVYGKISISDDAIALVARQACLDCYGIVEMVNKGFKDAISGLLVKGVPSTGVRIATTADKIFIDLYVIIKFGVSLSAVGETLKQTVKYNIEKFTGMVVDSVNVNIMGVKS